MPFVFGRRRPGTIPLAATFAVASVFGTLLLHQAGGTPDEPESYEVRVRFLAAFLLACLYAWSCDLRSLLREAVRMPIAMSVPVLWTVSAALCCAACMLAVVAGFGRYVL